MMNQMPSATGVRIAGDNYQWGHGWRLCLQMLYENATESTPNPAVAVGLEARGAGNADDVVLYRRTPPNMYAQVKYAVDQADTLNLEYLEREGILRKLVAARRTLGEGAVPTEVRLITNRLIDPNDVLLRDRDGRDGRLAPRALQGGANSARGKERTRWANAADAGVNELNEFLGEFYVDAGYDAPMVDRELGFLSAACGLQSTSAAIEAGKAWVAAQVIAGNRRLSLSEVQDFVATAKLQSTQPWETVSVSTIKPDPNRPYAVAILDWVENMNGDDEFSRVEPRSPLSWSDLAQSVAELPSRFAPQSRVMVSGFMRQATGFLTGSEFRRVKGYSVAIRQGMQTWSGEIPAEQFSMNAVPTEVNLGPDLAIIVNFATDGAGAAMEWIGEAGLPVKQIITVTPAKGPGPTAVQSPGAASAAALAIRDIARRNVEDGDVHLFLIGPLGLAVLLGHDWNRVATTHVYEHVRGRRYVKAFDVRA